MKEIVRSTSSRGCIFHYQHSPALLDRDFQSSMKEGNHPKYTCKG